MIDLNGGRLGILAGSGDLPQEIFEHCQTNDIDCYALYFKGQSDTEIFPDVDHSIVKLGQAQKSLNLLKKNGCTHIVFAGSIRRPGLFDIRPDLRAARFFKKLGLGAAGDDRLLRAIRRELEEEGFLILGAHDILPQVLTPLGNISETVPSDQDMEDIKYGWKVLEKTGELDVGQACIVQQGIVLGIEAAEGTDALIERCGDLVKKGGGGVLVKRAKPTQDMSLDLPTVGEVTVQKLQAAGLDGMALEAGRSQILNQTETISAANAAGLFVIGLDGQDV